MLLLARPYPSYPRRQLVVSEESIVLSQRFNNISSKTLYVKQKFEANDA
jgi:hypothetical protein